MVFNITVPIKISKDIDPRENFVAAHLSLVMKAPDQVQLEEEMIKVLHRLNQAMDGVEFQLPIINEAK